MLVVNRSLDRNGTPERLSAATAADRVKDLLAAVGIALFVAIGVWLWRTAAPVATSQAIILEDVSPSCAPKERCRDLETLAARAELLSRGALTLSLYSTGDASTGGRPVFVDKVSRSSATHIYDAPEPSTSAFVAAVGALCPKLARRNDSPVASGIAGALASFDRQECAKASAECGLFVRTDAIDSVLLARRRVNSKHPQPAPFDNVAGERPIHVYVCGIDSWRSNTESQLPSVKRVTEAIKEKFTYPDAVVVAGTCSVPLVPR
jgi:hypothetical protein